MESTRNVIFKSRKGWIVLTFLLSCFLIFYWLIKNKNEMIVTASVKGILYDAANGQPISDAIIMITEGPYEHPDIAAQTNTDGVFYLPDLKLPGTYTLQINANNNTKTIQATIENKDDILKIHF